MSRHCSVHVFIRIRPLTTPERVAGEHTLAFTVVVDIVEDDQSHKPTATLTLGHRVENDDLPARNKAWRSRGLTGVVRPEDNNTTAFTMTVQPLIVRVIHGETVCCFCYGHTASGKTHTIVGYDDEYGLYRHAAALLCAGIREHSDLILSIRFAEVYQGKIYDLLDNRAECFIREDGDGQIHIRSSTQMDASGRVRVQSLQAEYARTEEQVAAIVNGGLRLRAIGSSGVHDQSSRSHAVMEMEIVTSDIVNARKALVDAEAEIVPIGKKRDSKYISIMSRSTYTKDPVTNQYTVQMATIPQEEHDELAELNAQVDRAQSLINDLRQQEKAFVHAARELVLHNTRSSTQADLHNPPTATATGCGKLVFVDLAGAEYATPLSSASVSRRRNATEIKEAQEINGSLLALKECMRSLHQRSKQYTYNNNNNNNNTNTATISNNNNNNNNNTPVHIPFRNSKLTLFLRPYLVAELCTAVMIANISLAVSQASGSANTMQYAELVAATNS